MFSIVTEEHRMIGDSVDKLFKDLAATDTSMRQRDESRISADEVRNALVDLGLFGNTDDDLPMCTAQVQVLVARQAGAAALPCPVLEMLASHALSMRFAALRERTLIGASTLSNRAEALDAMPQLKGAQLYGTAHLVPFCSWSQRLLVQARRGDDIVLAEVELSAARITRTGRASVESSYRLDDLRFDGTPVTPVFVQREREGQADLARWLGLRTSLLAAAEIAGACHQMVIMTRDYLLVRSQFGQVLGANQALKHALADCHVQAEALAAMVDYAAAALDAGADDAEVCVHAAKQFANRAGKMVAEGMLQLHGAIGYTMEYPLHLLMHRVYRLMVSYGSGLSQGDKLFQNFAQLA